MTALDLDGLREALSEAEKSHNETSLQWRSQFDCMHQRAMKAEARISALEREVMQARSLAFEEATRIADAYDGGEWEANRDASVAAQAGRDIASYIRTASRAALTNTSSDGAS